ncbi:MAG: hypothetical protein GC159_06085 [Phycisphaera sp.]|nr:hypothetical protein [Phycisphaera sp.]
MSITRVTRRAVVCATLLVTFTVMTGVGAADKSLKLPAGLKGFSGQLKGTVVEAAKDGRGFAIKVTEIGKTWKKNTAKNPQEAIGKTLLINAQFGKNDAGKPAMNESHVRFIKSLKRGEELTVEAVNDEGERLHLLELSKEQRERGGEGGDKK